MIKTSKCQLFLRKNEQQQKTRFAGYPFSEGILMFLWFTCDAKNARVIIPWEIMRFLRFKNHEKKRRRSGFPTTIIIKKQLIQQQRKRRKPDLKKHGKTV